MTINENTKNKKIQKKCAIDGSAQNFESNAIHSV